MKQPKSTKDNDVAKVTSKVNPKIPAQLTPEVLQAVSELDSIVSDLRDAEMVASELTGIFGVFVGIKPAALTDVTRLEHDGVKFELLCDIVMRMGLYIEKIPHPDEGYVATVSWSRDLAGALRDLWLENFGDKEIDEDDQYKIGELFGYPKTATAYYIERTRRFDTTGELLDTPNVDTIPGVYTQLIFSPNNYEEELAAYSIPFEQMLKIIAPKTYAYNRAQHSSS